jgi:hypothetical protein
MGSSRRLPVTRAASWAIVIGGHVLLVVLLASIRPREHAAEPEPRERTVLLFLNLSVPEEERQPEQKPEPDRLSASNPSTPALPELPASSTAIQEEAPPARGPVDWFREAEQVAQERGAELLRLQESKCDPSTSDRPGSLLPKCGSKRKPAREWNPEPARFGLSGLLPYVRLGERCAIGLGFFGCALGKLPEADGHVFDDMRDPDRPRSSVPDIPGKE